MESAATEWQDVTYSITEQMVCWPGQPTTTLERVSSLGEGQDANVSVLRLSLHSGTHMDAPLHFFEDGADITHAPLAAMMGPVRVAQIGGDAVSKAELEAYEARAGALERGERIFFRTRNSSRDWLQEPFAEDYVAVATPAAQHLVERGVLTVGVDYLSVAPFQNPTDTHRTLLGAGVWVIEGLDLRNISEGRFELLALPLNIVGSDAAPLRVLLRRNP